MRLETLEAALLQRAGKRMEATARLKEETGVNKYTYGPESTKTHGLFAKDAVAKVQASASPKASELQASTGDQALPSATAAPVAAEKAPAAATSPLAINTFSLTASVKEQVKSPTSPSLERL